MKKNSLLLKAISLTILATSIIAATCLFPVFKGKASLGIAIISALMIIFPLHAWHRWLITPRFGVEKRSKNDLVIIIHPSLSGKGDYDNAPHCMLKKLLLSHGFNVKRVGVRDLVIDDNVYAIKQYNEVRRYTETEYSEPLQVDLIYSHKETPRK